MFVETPAIPRHTQAHSEGKRRSIPSHAITLQPPSFQAGHGGNGMPKYGGIGGQGACIYFEAKEDVTLKEIWKSNPTKKITARETKLC